MSTTQTTIAALSPEQQSPVTFAKVRRMLAEAIHSRRQTPRGRQAEKDATNALIKANATSGAVQQAWLDRASLAAETACDEAARACS